MQSGRISGTTRTIGKSQGYIGLSIRDELIDVAVNGPGTPAMSSAWFPDPAELAAIAAGAPIILQLFGTLHPPVIMKVGDVPDDGMKDDKAKLTAAANFFDSLAAILDGWAKQSIEGGWSTHQTEANETAANECRRMAGLMRRPT